MSTKTPEEMAEEHANKEMPDRPKENIWKAVCKFDFLAGYQAAKDEYKVAIDTYNDVAKQMLHEAVRIMTPTDEIAEDVLGACNVPEKPDGWISVKDRLPEIGEYVLVTHRTSEDYTNLGVMEATRVNDDEYETWGDFGLLADYVDYWMPLPPPPKEKP